MSMIDSTMPAVAFAKKLRARREELKKRREVETKAHRVAVVKWRSDLALWIRANAAKLAAGISAEERRYGEVNSLPARGMPQPPRAPTGKKAIRTIDSILRRLAITGQKTVRLVPEEVDEVFGDTEASEDDA